MSGESFSSALSKIRNFLRTANFEGWSGICVICIIEITDQFKQCSSDRHTLSQSQYFFSILSIFKMQIYVKYSTSFSQSQRTLQLSDQAYRLSCWISNNCNSLI